MSVHPPPQGEPRYPCQGCGRVVRLRVLGHEGRRLCLECARVEVLARGPVRVP